ncbi:AAA family ATPase [Desulfosoma sp.]
MRPVKRGMRAGEGFQGIAGETAGSTGTWEAIFLGGPFIPQHGSLPHEPEPKAGGHPIPANPPKEENNARPEEREKRLGLRRERVPPARNIPIPIPKKILPHVENLWANIIVGVETSSLTVLVCGPAGKEGASATAFYTAAYSALGHGLRTVYIDLDFQKTSKFYKTINDNMGGFAGFCLYDHSMESIIKSTDYENLYIIPPGAAQGVSLNTAVSQKARLDVFFKEIRSAFDVAVIDGPPILKGMGILGVARLVDHVILACRYGQTRYEVAGLAARKLEEVGVKRLSAVLTFREYPVPKAVYRWLK